MNFLEKILANIVKYGTLLLTGAPLFGSMVPSKDQPAEAVVLGDIQQFVGIAQTVEVTATAFEASGNADGKIKAISLGISQTLLSTPFLTGHKIQNTAAFQQACNLYAQATQQLLASLHPNGVVVSDKTAK